MVVPAWAVGVAAAAAGGVKVVGCVAWPWGMSKPTVKAIEAASCVKDGAAGVFVVPRGEFVLAGDWAALREELAEIVRGARAARAETEVGVAVPAAWLAEEKVLAAVSRAARESGCDVLVVVGKTTAEGLTRVNVACEGVVGVVLMGDEPGAEAAMGAGAVGVVVP